MCSECSFAGIQAGTTWIKPHEKEWREVAYTIATGPSGEELAIYEGGIILGTRAEIEKWNSDIKKFSLMGQKVFEIFGLAIKGKQYRWKDRKIPYNISANLPDTARVKNAIAHWEEHTEFRFPKRTTEADYIEFVPSSGCSSRVGRQGGRQEIHLGSACTTGNCIHEIGHAVGLWHEQSREDRDNYVTVDFSNIDPNYSYNFNKQAGVTLGGYDYDSIMHYPGDAFALDRTRPTIVPKNPARIGQRERLSAGDIAAAAAL